MIHENTVKRKLTYGVIRVNFTQSVVKIHCKLVNFIHIEWIIDLFRVNCHSTRAEIHSFYKWSLYTRLLKRDSLFRTSPIRTFKPTQDFLCSYMHHFWLLLMISAHSYGIASKAKIAHLTVNFNGLCRIVYWEVRKGHVSLLTSVHSKSELWGDSNCKSLWTHVFTIHLDI